MHLFYSPNSPYARKCRVVVLEKGLGGRVECVQADPWGAGLTHINPLGTVPALSLDDGTALCDSSVICEYLDTESTTHPLYPAVTKDRLHTLAFAALAEGMIDAAVACVIENMRRPEDKRWPEWIKRKEAAVLRALPLIEPYLAKDSSLSIATITLGVALSYISFRQPHLNWRKESPAIAAWFDEFSKRPSMEATKAV